MPKCHGCYYCLLPLPHPQLFSKACLHEMSPVQLSGGTAHGFCLIKQSQRKKENFGGVTEVQHKQCVVALINTIVAPVDCFYIIPLAHTADAIVTPFLFLVEQCCGGSSNQTASMGHHHCNLLAAPHILFFCLSEVRWCHSIAVPSLQQVQQMTCCSID